MTHDSNGTEEFVAKPFKTEKSEDTLYGGTIYPLDADIEQKDYSSDENFLKLTQYGLDKLVAAEFCEMFNAGIMTPETCEERTLEFSKNMKPDHARFVLNQFRKSNLIGVNQPSQYLGSLVKNFKERIKLLGAEAAMSTPVIYAPKTEKLQAILDRTGYSTEVTIGQRKYGGPPPDYDGPSPGAGCEVYIGRIPKDVYEDELIPLFEKYGKLYDLRLMMDPVSGANKGYAFATYMTKEEAAEAAKKLDEHEIKFAKKLRVNVSIANTRLFIGNIPKAKSKDEIFKEFTQVAELEGVKDIIIYADAEDPETKKNCGYCFVEFIDHKSASTAKRRLADGHVRPWNSNVVANWAEPQEEPDDEIMAQVRTIFIKNLRDTATEDIIRKAFGLFGEVFKVRKVKDYAFVYYNERDNALKAIEKMNGKDFHGSVIEVSLAKPQSDNRRRSMQTRMNRRDEDVMMSRGYDMYPPAYGGYYDPYAASGYGYDEYGYGGMPSSNMRMGGMPGRSMGGMRGSRGGPGMGGATPLAGGMRARASPSMAAQFRMRGSMPAMAATAGGIGSLGQAAYGRSRGGGIPLKRPYDGGMPPSSLGDVKRRYDGYGMGGGAAGGGGHAGYWGAMGGPAGGRPY